jgi:hypothetical protein
MHPVDKRVDFPQTGGDENMAQEYGRFECKICGNQVFVPLSPRPKDGHDSGNLYELTCSNGHTDAYDLSKLESISAKPVKSLNIRRAVAGIG